MTKIKEKNKNDEKELCEKLIDLLIIYQIEDSHRLIELISHRIKFYDIYIQQLFATKWIYVKFLDTIFRDFLILRPLHI